MSAAPKVPHTAQWVFVEPSPHSSFLPPPPSAVPSCKRRISSTREQNTWASGRKYSSFPPPTPSNHELSLFVTLGVPTAPFIFGFVALRVGYRWIYWILACVSIPPNRNAISLSHTHSNRPTPSNFSSTSSSARKRATSVTNNNTNLPPVRSTLSSPSAASTPPRSSRSTSSPRSASSRVPASSSPPPPTPWSSSSHPS